MSACGRAHLCMMLLVLLQDLDDQLGQADVVLKFFGRGD